MEISTIPPGTLAMLVLKTLAREGRLHGFEIARDIQRASADVLRVEEGSLYPALQRLLVQGFVRAEWGTTAENRRARYYQVTAAGRRELESEVSRFRRVFGAISGVLQES